MKRQIVLSLLMIAVAFGTTTIYSVEPLSTANRAFVQTATESLVATADSISAADIFIGQNRGVGHKGPNLVI